jgi:hypothetical protein
MLALGHFEHADSLDIDDPQALAALTAAQAFRENSKAFVNLSLYEQRLQRAQKEALRQLEELQTKRRAAKQAAEAKTEFTPNPHKTKAQPTEPGTSQFVYSTAGIEREATRPAPPSGAQATESPFEQAA